MKDFITVPISYEYLMSGLFGKLNYHGHVGALITKYWKRDILKINKYIKKTIRLNVQSDQIHLNAMLKICDELEKQTKDSKTINGVNAAFVELYTTLIFLLLGNIPDHWNRRSPYADRFWLVNGHRSLEYHQTNLQKTYLIINAVDIRKIVKINLDDYEDMHQAFYRGAKGDADRFIAWFKNTYPEKYCEIF